MQFEQLKNSPNWEDFCFENLFSAENLALGFMQKYERNKKVNFWNSFHLKTISVGLVWSGNLKIELPSSFFANDVFQQARKFWNH